MMPVIRINDATFADLKSISTWLGTETPSETVNELVREMMEKLDLERDLEIETSQSETELLNFKEAPGLSFTRLVSASINNKPIEKPNWSSLLLRMIEEVHEKGVWGQKLVDELQVPALTMEYSVEGYRYYSQLGISVQGQSAQDAWKEINRIAKKWRIPIEVHFQWRENEKAQYPGRSGILRSG